MSHAHHEKHPGYSAGQVLHDGCDVCQERSWNLAVALSYMDPPTFARAWRRAAAADRKGLPDAAEAEMPLLEALAAVQRQLAAGSPAAVASGLVPALP